MNMDQPRCIDLPLRAYAHHFKECVMKRKNPLAVRFDQRWNRTYFDLWNEFYDGTIDNPEYGFTL